jgi:uncharacterized damage-inducible protein DinB
VPDPTIEAARDILDDSLREMRAALLGSSTAELNRRPSGDDTNSIAVLVTHAMHSTRSWLSLATGAPLPDRDRPAEFLVIAEDPAAFTAWFDEMAADCRALLDDDVRFEPGATHVAPWQTDEDAEPVTAAWALLHALEHLREHVGHAQLTRQVR